ncbi:MAG: hypothetical protein ACLGG6_00465 [Gammaproteobacteria bacterium]
MTYALFPRLALCACLLPAGAAVPAWADPAAPFKTFQGWRDEPVQDWRAVNDRVGEVGGWRTYLREAQPAGGGGHDHGAAPPQPAAHGDHGHHGHHHGH